MELGSERYLDLKIIAPACSEKITETMSRRFHHGEIHIRIQLRLSIFDGIQEPRDVFNGFQLNRGKYQIGTKHVGN